MTASHAGSGRRIVRWLILCRGCGVRTCTENQPRYPATCGGRKRKCRALQKVAALDGPAHTEFTVPGIAALALVFHGHRLQQGQGHPPQLFQKRRPASRGLAM